MNNELFDNGLKIRRKYSCRLRRCLDQECRRAHNALQELVTQYCWGEIWARPGLDRRTPKFSKSRHDHGIKPAARTQAACSRRNQQRSYQGRDSGKYFSKRHLLVEFLLPSIGFRVAKEVFKRWDLNGTYCFHPWIT